MIYYPDAPTIKTLTVPFTRLWYEGGGGLLSSHWFASFLRDSTKPGFDPMTHLYAKCARYGAALRARDTGEIESLSRDYLQARLAWYAGYDAALGQLDPLPVSILADGRIVLLDGHHRAAMICTRGYPAITAAVKYVSPTWQDISDALQAVAGYDYVYAPIDHPWFAEWKTMRDSGIAREKAVVAAVMGISKQIPARSWYDVGSCTGVLCRVAERAGWSVVGLEYQALFVKVAECLNGYFGTHVNYYRTDRFQDVIAGAERRPGRSVGCVSVLSTLHHWLRDGKGDANYTAAVQTIADNSWCFVIDQDIEANGLNLASKTKIPLGSDPAAYAQWLRSTIGCKCVQHIGTFDLGRPVFLASKVIEWDTKTSK